MRLIVARCEVLYTGRLATALPMAVRLLVHKSDGSGPPGVDGFGRSRALLGRGAMT